MSGDPYAGLDPQFLVKLIRLKAECEKAGIAIKCTCGYRTIEEQDALYAKGRTKPGKIVTNAKGGYSWHNYRLAADYCFLVNGKISWDGPWEKFGKIAKSVGLEWGGDWKKFPDRPHVQWFRVRDGKWHRCGGSGYGLFADEAEHSP